MKVWSLSPNHWTAREFLSFFFFFKLYWEYDVAFCEDWLSFKNQLHWYNISRPRSCEVHGNVIATKKKRLQTVELFELLCLLFIHLWSSIYGQSIALLAGSVQFPAAIALIALSLYAFHGGLGNQITKLARIVCCCCSQTRIQLFVTPWTAAYHALLSSTIFQSLLKFMCEQNCMYSGIKWINKHRFRIRPTLVLHVRIMSFTDELGHRFWLFGSSFFN